jgi:hypothetical protein
MNPPLWHRTAVLAARLLYEFLGLIIAASRSSPGCESSEIRSCEPFLDSQLPLIRINACSWMQYGHGEIAPCRRRKIHHSERTGLQTHQIPPFTYRDPKPRTAQKSPAYHDNVRAISTTEPQLAFTTR